MTDVSSELIATLTRLVAIDSTSSRTNAPIIDLIAGELAPLGFALERLPYRDEAGVEKVNLLARSQALLQAGPGARAELALVGHTDCVPFDAKWTDALCLTEKDGKLYGRGACDTKAFIACALVAVRRLEASRLPRPLLLVFTADEEVGCEGAKRLVDANQGRARYAIVGEPTSLTPIRAHKGYCLAEVEVEGVEGHSAYPDAGASAIFRAARLLTRIEEKARGALHELTDVRFEPPFTSVNVGVIQGGKAKNIIPGACRFILEWRPIPGQAPGHVASLLDALVAEEQAREPGFKANVRVLRLDAGVDTRADSPLVAFLEARSGNASATVSFGTEAPQLTALGAEAVVFGPGDIRVAHRTGEFVPCAELTACEGLLEQALVHFVG